MDEDDDSSGGGEGGGGGMDRMMESGTSSDFKTTTATIQPENVIDPLIWKQRTKLFQSLLQFFPEKSREPKESIVDAITWTPTTHTS